MNTCNPTKNLQRHNNLYWSYQECLKVQSLGSVELVHQKICNIIQLQLTESTWGLASGPYKNSIMASSTTPINTISFYCYIRGHQTVQSSRLIQIQTIYNCYSRYISITSITDYNHGLSITTKFNRTCTIYQAPTIPMNLSSTFH